MSAGARADLTLVPGMTPAQASAASDTQQIYNYFLGQTNLTPDQQALFNTARELVQTSNEQQGSGPTVFSLGLTVQGLRNALQWVAAEELGTPGTMATKTTSGQLSSVAARLTALKFGVTGFNVNMSDSGFGLPDGRTLALAPGGVPQGGGAGADAAGNAFSKLGGFINGSLGFGSQSPSADEDAFDYGNDNLTVGLDYRLTDRFVYGAAFGYTYYQANFNSSQSVADGSVKSDAYTGSVYAMYDLDPFSVDGIVSYGANSFDIVRHIKYPSNNPAVPPTNETALGSPGAHHVALSVGGGYGGHRRQLTYTANAHVNYMHLGIDGYTEHNAHQFDLQLDSQSVTSLTSTVGGQLAYALSEPFGVVVPEVMAYWYHQFANDRREVVARYVADPLSDNFLSAPTNGPTRDYMSLGMGASADFRGGIQAFLNFQTLLGIRHISSYLFTMGVRYEF